MVAFSSRSSALLMSTVRAVRGIPSHRVHHGKWSSDRLPKAVIPKNCIYCFGNHYFQFLLGFQLFTDKALIELVAEEFVQWQWQVPLWAKAGISYMVGVQQPEVEPLRGCDSLNQSALLGTAVPAHFLGNEPMEFP